MKISDIVLAMVRGQCIYCEVPKRALDEMILKVDFFS